MIITTQNIILLSSILLFLSIVASKTSFKFGIPALLLFLVIGILAGSEGPGKIHFDDPHVAQFLGIIALIFILFSSGLDTKWETVRPIMKTGFLLSTISVFITAVCVALFAIFLFDFNIPEAMLLGSIVSSTDAAAVFSILRSKGFGLKGNLRSILEFESGSNDPMAYFLVISTMHFIKEPDTSIGFLLFSFAKGIIIGGGGGYLCGKLMVWIVNQIKLDVEGLYPVLMLSLVLFTYSITDFLEGNGFLAVYVAAIILGNTNFIHKKSLMRFYDGIAWIMQIIMFLTLGLFVFPSQIVPVMIPGILISIFLILLARPIAVFITLIKAKGLNFRKKLFISWVGLRGAVPIVFATFPLIEGLDNSWTIFHLVFFISVTSVGIQGTTIPLVARLLKLSVPEKIKRNFPLDLENKDNFKSLLLELDVTEGSSAIGKPIYKLDLPKSAYIVLLYRDDKYAPVTGETIIEKDDHLLVLADDNNTAQQVTQRFGIYET